MVMVMIMVVMRIAPLTLHHLKKFVLTTTLDAPICGHYKKEFCLSRNYNGDRKVGFLFTWLLLAEHDFYLG